MAAFVCHQFCTQQSMFPCAFCPVLPWGQPHSTARFPHRPPVSTKGQYLCFVFVPKLSSEYQLLTTAIPVEYVQDTSRAREECARR